MHRNNLRATTRPISVMMFISAHSKSDSYVSNDVGRTRRSLLNSSVAFMGGSYRSGWVGVPGGEDDAVITALYQVYRAPLMSFVLRLTGGDRQHAEDIVQETMVRAWREASRLDLSGPSLMPWLSAVARRIVIDDHRRKRSRPTESGES